MTSDGLVLVTNCDKIVPNGSYRRQTQPTFRRDLRCVSMMAGTMKGRVLDLNSVSFEGAGMKAAGKISDEELQMLKTTPVRDADPARECSRQIP